MGVPSLNIWKTSGKNLFSAGKSTLELGEKQGLPSVHRTAVGSR